MHNNTTAHPAAEFDVKRLETIPFYDTFYEQAIDVVRSIGESPRKWLDTGCGTGNIHLHAKKQFPETEFTLADPARKMLEIARGKAGEGPSFTLSDSQSLQYADDAFDVISAIQCHHYLDQAERKKAVGNCFRMLRPGGVFIVFENIRPLSEKTLPLALKRWQDCQIRCGKTAAEASQHMARFDHEFFPISILEHLRLLNETGFSAVEILWTSYLQAGFYALK